MPNTDKFIKVAPNTGWQLDASGISDASVTSFGLVSATSIPTDTAVILTIDRVDSSGVATPTKMERIVGVMSGTTVTSAIRGLEGTAQSHSSGAVVEIVISKSNINKLMEGILIAHDQDGTHKAGVVLNTPKITTSLNDANGNEVIRTPATASAVNEVTITNAATGGTPKLEASGDDADISWLAKGKGTGKFYPALLNGLARCTTNTSSASTVVVDVIGATSSFTLAVASKVIVNAFFDFNSNTTGDIAAGYIVINNVVTTEGTSVVYQTPAAGYRATVGATANLTLAAGTHTIKLQINRPTGSGTVTATSENTGFTYFAISQ